MSDSASGDSDVQDFKDLDMIFELARLEQQQQEEVERVRHRNYIYREWVEAEARLMVDYFGPRPKYRNYYFRLWYRMSRKLFLDTVSALIVCTGNGKISQKHGMGNLVELDVVEKPLEEEMLVGSSNHLVKVMLMRSSSLFKSKRTHDSINNVINAIVEMRICFHDVSIETSQEHAIWKIYGWIGSSIFDSFDKESNSDGLTFNGTVYHDTFQFKESTNIVGRRKVSGVWSLGFLRILKRCKVLLVGENGLTVVRNLEDLIELSKRVLTRTGLITPVKQNEKRAVHKVSTSRPVSTVRPVSTARPFSTVRPFAPKIAQTSGAIRPIYSRMDNVRPRGSYSPINEVGLAALGKLLGSDVQESGSFMPRRIHAVVDSGCSSHMTGNKAYLFDYEDYNGGFVAFGSDPKGGKITGKGKIRTANLDFDDVYFVDELNFKLLDESQVVLRAPRKDDVYSLNLKNIVPSGGIKREFSMARTPQQNGVAERKTRPLLRQLNYVNRLTFNIHFGQRQ
ncbi:hypothetical protein Tco_0407203 [Tanacetum coccineum]